MPFTDISRFSAKIRPYSRVNGYLNPSSAPVVRRSQAFHSYYTDFHKNGKFSVHKSQFAIQQLVSYFSMTLFFIGLLQIYQNKP